MADHNHSAFSTWEEFMNHGLQNCTSASQIPEGLDCGICLENLDLRRLVVKVFPCTHCYFHKDCLMTWFDAAHQQSTTCPKDRRLLFPAPAPVQGQAPARPYDIDFIIDGRITHASILINRMTTHFQAAHSLEEISTAWLTSMENLWIPALILDIRALRNPRPESSAAALQRAYQMSTQFQQDFVTMRNRYLGAARDVIHGRVDQLLAIARDLAASASRDYQGHALQVTLTALVDDMDADPGMQDGADVNRINLYVDRLCDLKRQVNHQQQVRQFDRDNDRS